MTIKSHKTQTTIEFAELIDEFNEVQKSIYVSV